MLTNIKKKKRKNEITKENQRKKKENQRKKKGVTKKSANLIRNHDEEFRVACS